MSSVPKFPRTYHLPFSPEVHADDKRHSSPEIFVGENVVVLEKLDGGNTCLHRGSVFARSTGQPTSHPTFDYIKATHAPKTLGYDIHFYGENLFGIHSIEYTELRDYFFLFAVLDGGRWLAWHEVESYAEAFNFATVPLVFEGRFASLGAMQAFLDGEIDKPSALGGQREGFVVRLASGFADYSVAAAKYVRRGHVQTDEHWTKNWRAARLAG